MQRLTFFVTTIILLLPLTVGAIPQFLQHQGYMANDQGEPESGSANVTFDLYTVESEGSSMWTQTIAVTFDNGHYSVVLGPGSPDLSVTIFDGSELYLGTTLEGQDQFSPRMQISSVPYAFRAEAVEGEVKAVGGLVVDGVEVINDQQQWVGLGISFTDLADIPSDLADGDDVGVEGSGTDGALTKFTESGIGDSVITETDGKIGVGITDPQSAFHVAGGIQLQDDTDDCVEGKEGTLRWHENQLEVCDGSSWNFPQMATLDELYRTDGLLWRLDYAEDNNFADQGPYGFDGQNVGGVSNDSLGGGSWRTSNAPEGRISIDPAGNPNLSLINNADEISLGIWVYYREQARDGIITRYMGGSHWNWMFDPNGGYHQNCDLGTHSNWPEGHWSGNTWMFLVITWEASTGKWRLYRDGVHTHTYDMSVGSMSQPADQNNAIGIGARNDGYESGDMNVGIAWMYGVKLSDADIALEWNSYKSRFGL